MDDFEELDKFIRGEAPAPKAAPAAPAPAEVPKGQFEELDRFIQNKPAVKTEDLIPDIDRFIKGEAAPEPAGSRLAAGVLQGLYGLYQTPGILEAARLKYMGDDVAAYQKMEQLEAEKRAANIPELRESFEKTVADPSRLGDYAAETLGSLVPDMLLTLTGAGLGVTGLKYGTRLGAYALPKMVTYSEKAATRAAKIGAGVGMAGALLPVETAGTIEEMYGATGEIYPEAGLGAGALKTGIEFVGPGLGRLSRQLMTPGSQLAKESFGKALGKTVAGEALVQELPQEEVDIQLRSLLTAGQQDPYNAWGSEAWYRRGGAVFGGALGGLAFGAPGVALEKRQKAPTPVTEEDPGWRSGYSPVEEVSGIVRSMPQLQAVPQAGPDVGMREMANPPDPTNQDPNNLSLMLKQSLDAEGISRGRMLEEVERGTDRYAIVGPDGRSLGGRLYSDTEVEQALASMPPGAPPQVVRVRPESIDVREMSADVFDLPGLSSGRVYFLPEVAPDAKADLLAKYNVVQRAAEGFVQEGGLIGGRLEYETGPREDLEKAMRPLLAAGLRVLPSRGRGFWYNGNFDGVPGIPATSGRSKHVGVWDPGSGEIVTDHRGWMTEDGAARGIPVALDLNRLEPGDVSGVPQLRAGSFRDLPGWRFREGLSESKKQELFDWLDREGFQQPTAEQLQRLMSEGMWYEPSKASPGLVPREGLDIRKFTYGVQRDRAFSLRDKSLGESGKMMEGVRAQLQQPKSTVEVGLTDAVLYEPELTAEWTARIERELKKYPALVDKILAKFGIHGGVRIVVTTTEPISVIPGAGTIFVNPEQVITSIENGETTGSIEGDVNSSLMHELGHIVADAVHKRLSVSDKLKFRQSYNRALLADRLQVEGLQGINQSEFTATTNPRGQARYYMAYSEYLAEQFRRMIRTNGDIRHEFELAMPGVARELERFYQEFERKAGTKAAFNLRHPDAAVGAVLDSIMRWEQQMAPLRRLEQQQEMYRLAYGINFGMETQEVLAEVVRGIESLGAMVLPDVAVMVQGELPGGAPVQTTIGPRDVESVGFWSRNVNPFALIEIAAGSLKTKEGYGVAREQLTEGMMNAYHEAKLFTAEETRTLAEEARKTGISLGPHTQSILRERAKKFAAQFKWTAQEEADYIQRTLDQMLSTRYAVANVNNTKVPTAVGRIIEKVLAVLRAVRARLMGTGYYTREQLLHAIYRGEIAARYVPGAMLTTKAVETSTAGRAAKLTEVKSVVPVDAEMDAHVSEYGGTGPAAKKIVYQFFRRRPGMEDLPAMEYVGELELKNHTGLGFEVQEVETVPGLRKQGYATRMHRFWQTQLGAEHKPSGILTSDGYGYWSRKNPEAVKYHIFSKEDGFWYSPRRIEQLIAVNEMGLDASPNADARSRQVLQTRVSYYKRLRARIDKAAWSDPALKRAFAKADAAQNGIQGSITREGMEADAEKLGDALEGKDEATTDSFEQALQEDLQWSQAENARVLGIAFEDAAPQTLASDAVRGMLQHGARSPMIPPDLRPGMRVIAATQDRMSWMAMKWWGIQQAGFRNEHVPELRSFVQHVDQMGQVVTRWTTRADETTRAWERMGANSRREIGNLLFWMAEMHYLTPQERAAGVVRDITPQERQAEMQRRRFTLRMRQMVDRIQQDFTDFISAVFDVRAQHLQGTIQDPMRLQIALAKLAVQQQEMLAKPYFPFTRFGKHTIAVRDNAGQVVWFSAYETAGERNRAYRQVAARYPQGYFIQRGMVPEEAAAFQNLPAPLLEHIQETMPNLTQVQEDWLRDFAAAHLPGNTFRRSWAREANVGGFSLDALRAYGSYFQHGSNYLARLQYELPLQRDLTALEQTTHLVPNNTDRVRMLKNARATYKYIMSDPKDFRKWRAGAAFWQLAGSVVAAFNNLLQVHVFTIPYLHSTFGYRSSRHMRSLFKMMRRGATTTGLGPAGAKGRRELINQGRIQVGQTADLAGYAEGFNLTRWLAGSRTERAFREASYILMSGFQGAERLNRELTYRMSFDLAMAYPQTRRLQEIGNLYTIEIDDLITRLQVTHQEAVAILFAKQTIDQTQGNYSPWAKSPVFRNRWSNLFFMFVPYMQMMAHALRWNNSRLETMAILILLYGLKGGLPGADDLQELVKTIGWMIGQDWNPERAVKNYMHSLVKGSRLEGTAGPDLVIHGLSRYGLGIGLFPEHWGMPRFDVWSNGQMGSLVPGWKNFNQRIRWKSDWEGAFASGMEGIGGASLGPVFGLLQYLSEPPGTVNSHRYEAGIQRAVRDGMKAYRYSTEGETTRQGGRVVKLDWSDPEDVATIIASYGGFKPTEVTQYWENWSAEADRKGVFDARRSILYEQAWMAFERGSEEAWKGVAEGAARYNADVDAAGYHGMQVSMQQIRQSVTRRDKTIKMQEMDIPEKRSWGIREEQKRYSPEFWQHRKPVQ